MAYKVMIADDEPIMRKALLTLTDWGKMNCEVVFVASNGQEVLDNLESAAPDILITDIRMPGVDGIQLSEYIKKKSLPIMVIILTAYADFSYAQSALKNDVVDYVIKNGVFDGLVEAVEKAQEKLVKKQEKEPGVVERIITENILKAIFDGSLYEPVEIQKGLERCFLIRNSFVILAMKFSVHEENKFRAGKTIYESLKKFFDMVFTDKLLGAVAVEKDMFAIVLECKNVQDYQKVEEQCNQMIDMINNFMKLNAFIGISAFHKDMLSLRDAYEEAEKALEYDFIKEEHRIRFYESEKVQDSAMPKEADQKVKAICSQIAKGNKDYAMQLFEELIELCADLECSAHLVKNIGILIQDQCRRILKECDKNIYEVTELTNSISSTIYHCRYMREYRELMTLIIRSTADAVHMSVNRKKSLVNDCEKYIDENFEGNILVVDIAKYVGASPSYLSRIFREETGQTIIYTLNQKKLKKAKEYLENTDMKIYEIAEKLGFENTTYFSHFFKKYVHVSPKEYREKM